MHAVEGAFPYRIEQVAPLLRCMTGACTLEPGTLGRYDAVTWRQCCDATGTAACVCAYCDGPIRVRGVQLDSQPGGGYSDAHDECS